MLEILTIKDVKCRIGSWCRQHRKAGGLSQDALAHELDMSRITIQQLEAGKNVTLDTLLKVANHFGSLADLAGFFEKQENASEFDSLY